MILAGHLPSLPPVECPSFWGLPCNGLSQWPLFVGPQTAATFAESQTMASFAGPQTLASFARSYTAAVGPQTMGSFASDGSLLCWGLDDGLPCGASTSGPFLWGLTLQPHPVASFAGPQTAAPFCGALSSSFHCRTSVVSLLCRPSVCGLLCALVFSGWPHWKILSEPAVMPWHVGWFTDPKTCIFGPCTVSVRPHNGSFYLSALPVPALQGPFG